MMTRGSERSKSRGPATNENESESESDEEDREHQYGARGRCPEEWRAVGDSDQEAICRTIGFVFASHASASADLTSFFNSHCDA
jgi:hypothetical protein